jgi:glycosyltransferase involved in cell wall biosynthesis
MNQSKTINHFANPSAESVCQDEKAMFAPKFSIVVANYNKERYLHTALESIINQSFEDYEVIVVDDGSTDNSVKLIQERSPRFQGKLICICQSNKGVASARNVGVSRARGQYVAFLDSDDYWHPDRLKRHAEVLDEHADVGFCCGDFNIIQNGGKAESHFKKWVRMDNFPNCAPIAPIQAFRLLVDVNFVGTSGVSIRNSCLKALKGFDVRYRQAEDYDLWLRSAMITDFYVLPDVLHSYRVFGDGITANQKETLKCCRIVLENIAVEYQRFVMENGLSSKLRQSIARRWYEYGNVLFEEGRSVQAFNAYTHGVVSCGQFRNMMEFLQLSGRKLARSLTCGLVTRKNIQRLRDFWQGAASI